VEGAEGAVSFISGFPCSKGRGRESNYKLTRRTRYKLYHSVIGVLRSFYYGIDTVREMKERRTLAKILEMLEKLKTVAP
jgi:hypothetical protein